MLNDCSDICDVFLVPQHFSTDSVNIRAIAAIDDVTIIFRRNVVHDCLCNSHEENKVWHTLTHLRKVRFMDMNMKKFYPENTVLKGKC